jgi:hypothetical protein
MSSDYPPNPPAQPPASPPPDYTLPPAYQPGYPPAPGYAPVYAPPPQYAPPRANPLGFILAIVALGFGLLIDPLLTWALLGGGLTGAIVLTSILALAGIGLAIWAVILHHGSFQQLLTLALAVTGIALSSAWFVLAMSFWLAKPYNDGITKTLTGH